MRFSAVAFLSHRGFKRNEDKEEGKSEFGKLLAYSPAARTELICVWGPPRAGMLFFSQDLLPFATKKTFFFQNGWINEQGFLSPSHFLTRAIYGLHAEFPPTFLYLQRKMLLRRLKKRKEENLF